MTRQQGIAEFGYKLEHGCPEWDYMVIDKDSPEFECCLCFKDKK